MRRTVMGVIVGSAVLVGVALPAGAEPANLYRGFAAAVITMTNADPWLLDDGCTGGTSSKDALYVIAPGDTTASECTAAEGAPVVAVPAGSFCWQAMQKDARQECRAGWENPDALLVSAGLEVDGQAMALARHDAVGRVTFSDSLFGEADGTVAATYSIMQGAVVTGLATGAHTLHLTFAYADGFTGDTTVALTVGG